MCAPEEGKSQQLNNDHHSIFTQIRNNPSLEIHVGYLHEQLASNTELMCDHTNARTLVRLWIAIMLTERDHYKRQKIPGYQGSTKSCINRKASRLETLLYRSATSLNDFLDRTTLLSRVVLATRKIRLCQVNKAYKQQQENTTKKVMSAKRVRFADHHNS